MIYTGKVVRIMEFGAFVELAPNKDGMVHISKLSDKRVAKVEDVVNIGDEVTVRVVEVDRMGRINLTMRPEDMTADLEKLTRPERLNGAAYDKYMGRSLQRLLCSLRLMLIKKRSERRKL